MDYKHFDLTTGLLQHLDDKSPGGHGDASPRRGCDRYNCNGTLFVKEEAMEVVRKKGLVIGMLPSLINLQQEDLVDAQGDGHGGRVEDAEDQQVQHGRHD